MTVGNVHNLIEEVSLREKTHIFQDRKEAGRLLAEKLIHYKGTDTIVLGIPSGGIPVAAEIAHALSLPFDLIIVRKLQLPYNTEAGFGAMGPDGEIILNERLLDTAGLTEEEIKMQVKKTLGVIEKRTVLFRKERPFPSLKDKTAIIVDDGLASGYTMLAAIKFVKKNSPQKIVVAVPTGSMRTVDHIRQEVDECVCLNVRSRFPFAVADAYRNWYDLSDGEVLNIISTPMKNNTAKGGF